MEREFGSFRKVTFGGFNRKDVISYIERMRNESFEYKKQVDETVKSLNEKIRELENAARLIENAPDVGCDAMGTSDAGEGFGDIGNATKHLKVVADELCRSLGDFLDKLSEKGLFDKTEIAQEEAEEVQTDAPSVEQSFVDGILSSISYLGTPAEKTAGRNEKSQKAAASDVADILSGYSFLK